MPEARRTDLALSAKREKKGKLMKAVVYDMYGAPDVLRLANVQQGRRDMLLRVDTYNCCLQNHER
jgi:hypothetical protein